MQFKDYLASFPAIDHLRGLDVKNATGEVIHTIPAIEGKLGSLKLYHALFAKFDGKLTACSAQQGLEWFAEHVEDAKQYPGEHPNIDLLNQVISENLQLSLVPLIK